MIPAQRRSDTRPVCTPLLKFLPGGKRSGAGLVRLGAFAIMFGLLAVGVYSAASASSRASAGASRDTSREASPAAPRAARVRAPRRAAAPAAPAAALLPAMPFQAGETIATYESDCTTPSSTFELGDTVCAKVTGVTVAAPGGFAPRRVSWVARTGSIVQETGVTTAAESFSFTLPSSETTTVTDAGGGSVIVDNRGVWRVYISDSSERSFRTGATFTVTAPTPYADLQVNQSAPLARMLLSAGSSGVFEIFVTNAGPNDAANVVVTNAVPANASYISLGETTGLGFTCSETKGAGGVPGCTLASMPAGSSAKIVFDYEVAAGAVAETLITNVASVSSATAELAPDDNTSRFTAKVPGTSGAETCSLVCHENIVVTADATEAGQPGAFVAFGPASGVGNCGAINASPSSDSFFPVGATTVTVNSEDGGGSCSFTVTVVNTPAPTISCPADITVTVAQDATSATVSNLGSPTTNPAENVTVVGVRSDNLPQTQEQIDNGEQRLPVPLNNPYPLGTTLITWTVTDAAGRTASCVQRVTVRASERPELSISCPATVNAQAPSGSCEASVSPGTPTTNLTDSHVSVVGERNDGRPLTDPYPAGQTRITWTATDDTDGSVVSCVQSVNVAGASDTPPTLHVPADVTVETKSCSAIVDDELGVATAEAGCGGSAVSISRSGVPRRFIFRAGTTVITYTATDSAGRTVTGTQKVTVRESTPPTITAPADVQVFADASCQAAGVALGAPAFSDNCAGSTVSNDAPAAFPVGQTTVTWTVKDASGNTATDTQVVTVVDNTAPSVEAPETLSASANAECQVAVPTVTVTAADNCTAAGALTVTQSPAAGTMVGLGTHTVTVTVKDAAGNESSDTTEFTVADNTPPELNVPADIVVGNDADSCSAAVGFSVTATDNCGTANVQLSHQPGSVFQKGTTTVTATATDAAGNTTVKSFKVTVNDTQKPAISYPAGGVTVYLPLNSPDTSMPVTYTVTAADNCAVQSLNVSPASGSVFNVGTTTVTATATDTSGNVTTVTFPVKVLYNFTGFFSPVANLPTFNLVNAGRAVPVKFSLSGNKGLGIFPADSPASQPISCSTTAPTSDLEGTISSGGSTLSYDAGSDQYHYNWKTDSSWAGTCRALVVTLNDGTPHTAYFKFK
jgi:uncharacterized repeat protein (TIGR01451 family)